MQTRVCKCSLKVWGCTHACLLTCACVSWSDGQLVLEPFARKGAGHIWCQYILITYCISPFPGLNMLRQRPIQRLVKCHECMPVWMESDCHHRLNKGTAAEKTGSLSVPWGSDFMKSVLFLDQIFHILSSVAKSMSHKSTMLHHISVRLGQVSAEIQATGVSQWTRCCQAKDLNFFRSANGQWRP